MLENHGVVVGAENMLEAFGRFETMESLARLYLVILVCSVLDLYWLLFRR